MSENENTPAETAPQPVYKEIDPHELLLEDNVRTDPDYEYLIPSIQANGVYLPLLARWDAEGRVVVRDGQCRMLAAREAGVATVPVLVWPEGVETPAAEEAERIITQLVTTDKRAGINKTQRMRAMQALFATKAAKNDVVAKRLGYTSKEVSAFRKLTKSESAMASMEHRQLTMEEALIIAEFEGDEHALARLNNTARYNLDHVASLLRTEAKELAEYVKATKDYADSGFTIIEHDADPQYDGVYISVEDLVTEADGQPVTQEQIDANPAQWAVHLYQEYANVHIHSGEVIEDDRIDEDVDDDQPAAAGLVHYNLVDRKEVWFAAFYSTDPQAHGYVLAVPAQTEGNADEAPAEGISAEDKERRERRKLRELNKLGQAAEEVRRHWVKENLVAGRTAPKGAVMFIAQQLTKHSDLLTKNNGAQTGRELLGLQKGSYQAIGDELAELPAGAEGRATVLLLGQVIGSLEMYTPKDVWRNAGTPRAALYGSHSADYLRFLADHGYDLADIERVVLGEMNSDALYEQTAAELDAAKASKGKKATPAAQDTAAADLSPEEPQEADSGQDDATGEVDRVA